jgi:hypothetical protein
MAGLMSSLDESERKVLVQLLDKIKQQAAVLAPVASPQAAAAV